MLGDVSKFLSIVYGSTNIISIREFKPCKFRNSKPVRTFITRVIVIGVIVRLTINVSKADKDSLKIVSTSIYHPDEHIVSWNTKTKSISSWESPE